MQKETLNYILESVETQSYFSYQQDDYVRQLFIEALKQKDISKSELKQSQYAFLLNKPNFRKITAQSGGKAYSLSQLDGIDTLSHKAFSLSFGRWGKEIKHRNRSYYQTSCPSENLVLQLNFDLAHDLLYHKLFNVKEEGHPFTWDCHPISEKHKTMAWARIDLCLETEEAFIEEVQNDWLREAFEVHTIIKARTEKRRKSHWINDYTDLNSFEKYMEFLKPYQKLWSEAILMASLDFLLNTVGIQKVFYHSYESGNHFKQLRWSKPPKSLYTQLPKRFGFQKTKEMPQFWQNEHYLKKKIRTFEGELYCFDFRL
ncbi:hypothetical protein [Sediminitomix flava]|uniref:Uncharacterized protein n=1 Tax=Sediminitomix flava TaxID=379075 RepID=A0A315ZED6_SEDFL|nr:hypothetical protein [Sediminitomix flava]PWJ43178.1 hypothetical protein BC781_102727 [Sediminitomix flava]